jgi:hypothetical protein
VNTEIKLFWAKGVSLMSWVNKVFRQLFETIPRCTTGRLFQGTVETSSLILGSGLWSTMMAHVNKKIWRDSNPRSYVQLVKTMIKSTGRGSPNWTQVSNHSITLILHNFTQVTEWHLHFIIVLATGHKMKNIHNFMINSENFVRSENKKK